MRGRSGSNGHTTAASELPGGFVWRAYLKQGAYLGVVVSETETGARERAAELYAAPLDTVDVRKERPIGSPAS